MSQDIIVETNGLHKIYGSESLRVHALKGIDLKIGTGEMVAVMGPSGCGKTTLLNCLSGLDSINEGDVVIDNRPISSLNDNQMSEFRAKFMGFIFQTYNLLSVLTAQENVELRLHISGISWRERRRRSLEALALVGLESRAQHRPHEMSGGEQQRVAIARALVNNPAVLFADEPTGELDSSTAMNIGETLRTISTDSNVTVVVVTHDLTLARITDRRIHLEDGIVSNDY